MTFDIGEFFRSLDETTEESASLTTLWLILPRRVRSSPLFMFGWSSTEAILGTFKLLLPDSIRNTRCHKKTASTGEIKSHHCSLRSRTETKKKVSVGSLIHFRLTPMTGWNVFDFFFCCRRRSEVQKCVMINARLINSLCRAASRSIDEANCGANLRAAKVPTA